MPQIIFCFIFSLFALNLTAQNNKDTYTAYYSEHWQESNEANAHFIIKYKAILGSFTYVKSKKKNDSRVIFPLSWHEEVTNIDGSLISTGDFSKGYYDGKWTRFYPNGQVKEVRTYDTGFETKYLAYHDNGNFKFKDGKDYYRSGAIESEKKDISLSHSIKFNYFETGEIESKTYYHQDTIIADSTFIVSGELIDRTAYAKGKRTLYEEFHLNGVLSKTEDFVNDSTFVKKFSDKSILVKEETFYKYKKIAEQSYDEETGKRILPDLKDEVGLVFTIVEEMPSFQGCYKLSGSEKDKCTNTAIAKFIGEHYTYPAYALENNMEYKEYIRFVVNANGEVTDVTSARGSNSILTEFAMRLVATFPKFKPGMQRGKAVSVQYIIPINYRIA